jgi:transcriptional regulator with XRE-family HTH domain
MLSPEKRLRNKNALGEIIKTQRTAIGYTQKELADRLGLEYYTMISQLENGYVSVPPAMWVPLSFILKLNREEWVLMCLEEIAPEIYNALFGNNSTTDVAELLKRLGSDTKPPQ